MAAVIGTAVLLLFGICFVGAMLILLVTALRLGLKTRAEKKSASAQSGLKEKQPEMEDSIQLK